MGEVVPTSEHRLDSILLGLTEPAWFLRLTLLRLSDLLRLIVACILSMLGFLVLFKEKEDGLWLAWF